MGRHLYFPFPTKVACAGALLLAIPLLLPPQASAQADANPLNLLNGDWKGGGTMTPMGGDPEKVSCKVTYEAKDAGVVQNLRCAGVDTTIKTNTQMTYNAGKVTGQWTESTFDRQGGLNGTAKGNVVHARISGDKFSGRMSINITDKGHTINILQLDKGAGLYRPVATIAFAK
jgi:hypothetical protein